MNDIIEHVANAIEVAMWDSNSETVARAAIKATLEAIREPTKDQYYTGRHIAPKYGGDYRSVKPVYSAMIDRLLKEMEKSR